MKKLILLTAVMLTIVGTMRASNILAPFFTSASSGPGGTDRHLRKSIGYDVTWQPATRVNNMGNKELPT